METVARKSVVVNVERVGGDLPGGSLSVLPNGWYWDGDRSSPRYALVDNMLATIFRPLTGVAKIEVAGDVLGAWYALDHAIAITVEPSR
jgi:hypothetical protein